MQIQDKTTLLKIFDEQESILKELFSVTSHSLSIPDGTLGTHRYWSNDEHTRFMVCLCFLNATACKGLPVLKIAKYVKTRTSVQVRTHAQKYFSDKRKIHHTDPLIISSMRADIETLRKIFGREKPVMIYRSL
ncbi:hypothetical protein ENUP19_0002G0070 [Entamoeba nuttalli]|uniref:HTH myb-type domain-containing protein n=2 Tax=Entamoeba nuttalli TaxID=412467 RepID=K2I1U0_ENTNP|nr:hypothetical protein ENU1_011480 [Entamoeba nuttalli P19]EKE42755.1 hypothetical protein ENU1_011480 [Entamoeba nuttalli P19]|eukprot:XP_008854919.1 hypothetical protein ENU1_011480 [Entamoeba nuttalli P19]